jgi:hypothetical protein
MSHIQDLRLILRMRDERLKRERMELCIAAIAILAALVVSL